jgi:hypothetical protein
VGLAMSTRLDDQLVSQLRAHATLTNSLVFSSSENTHQLHIHEHEIQLEQSRHEHAIVRQHAKIGAFTT